MMPEVRMMRRRTMLGRGVAVVVVVWLLIGVLATWQRGYFESNEANCATAGTISMTVVAGPLNYAGVNPKVEKCNLPQPSA
jgi:DNA-binding transcriptional regulator of glucitol operon